MNRSKNFQRLTNLLGRVQFVVFENFTSAHLFEIHEKNHVITY